MGSFKIGDLVKVVDSGRTYSTYSSFMEKYGKKFINKYRRGYNPSKGEGGVIVATSEHESENKTLAIVENNSHVFIINVIGLELLPCETTVIYRKGRETIALLKDGNQTIKTAKAICNPNDEFNAEYGAKLAFARLFGLDGQVTEILLDGVKEIITDGNFKARCVKSSDAGLTVGKIYVFKNGYSNWNDGTRLPQFKANRISRFGNFADLQQWFGTGNGDSLFEEVIDSSVFVPTVGRIVKQDKYEVGDKVKVREDLKQGNLPDGLYVTSGMADLKGSIVTIGEIRSTQNRYSICEIGWSWSGDCFEGKVIEEPVPSGQPVVAPVITPFDWDGFKSGKFAVHCDTEEKAKLFLWECENQKILWKSDDKPTDHTRWEVYKRLTCYSCVWNQGKITYGDIPFHKGNRPIIDYTPNYREVKRHAKVGEWVKVINAERIPTTNGKDDYKNGDILKVLDTEFMADKTRYAKGTGDNGYERILNYEEYVVLEPITPITEESKPLDLSTIPAESLFEELRKRVQ